MARSKRNTKIASSQKDKKSTNPKIQKPDESGNDKQEQARTDYIQKVSLMVIQVIVLGILLSLIQGKIKAWYDYSGTKYTAEYDTPIYTEENGQNILTRKLKLSIYHFGSDQKDASLAYEIVPKLKNEFDILSDLTTIRKYKKDCLNYFFPFLRNSQDVTEGRVRDTQDKRSKYAFSFDKLSADWVYEIDLKIKSNDNKPIQDLANLEIWDSENNRIVPGGPGLSYEDRRSLCLTEGLFMGAIFVGVIVVVFNLRLLGFRFRRPGIFRKEEI